MKELVIVKIGGNIIDDEKALQKVVSTFLKIPSAKILIHGGGKLATELSNKLGIETKMIDGRRITDADTLKITTMVYAGWINKNIVAQLNSNKQQAIGISGADLLMIPSAKRKNKTINYGFVGDVISKKINIKAFEFFLKSNITPVIAPITCTKKGQLLNTNADSMASAIAIALSKKYKVKLIYCFEKEGVLDENEKVIPSMNKNFYKQLKQNKTIKDGMIPKLDNSFNAINNGVKSVYIGHAHNLKQLLKEKNGTVITKK